jgi:hypothetical protein
LSAYVIRIIIGKSDLDLRTVGAVFWPELANFFDGMYLGFYERVDTCNARQH